MKPYGAHGARIPVSLIYPMGECTEWCRSPVDGGHAFLAVALAGGGREVV
jgi:hypothetical protein